MTRDINRDEKEFCGIKFVGSLTARHRLLYYLFFWLMKQMAREDEADPQPVIIKLTLLPMFMMYLSCGYW
ncbi:hypothetical protein TNCT_605402 [Trichonephila clavata]|uniref:Uncharacterized protein n=1 Tax=Trichonephila clavata TaxID=2740835 RepID=A0A8X6GD65_TRICU|nr:hypothetical protein TNCT_605402 [Trichonephila clavata]